MRCPLTRSAGNALSVVSWVMGRVVSVDATHLLMASEDSDVVGMKATPQMHRKLKNPKHGTKNLSKGAKKMVRVFADIQNFALRARHSLSFARVWPVRFPLQSLADEHCCVYHCVVHGKEFLHPSPGNSTQCRIHCPAVCASLSCNRGDVGCSCSRSGGCGTNRTSTWLRLQNQRDCIEVPQGSVFLFRN